MLVVLFILLLMCAIIASLGYYTYTVVSPSGIGPTTTPIYRFEMVDDKPVITQIEPSNCKGDTYVKKKSCHNRQTGDLLDGTANKCGDGVEEWILDPDASGYQRAIGNGTCESDFRPCNVVCDTPCEGATWIEGACIRDGVVLDGSETDKCGRGMRTYTLDENAPDYVASTGRGTCTKTYSSACDVECPQNAVAPPACVYSSTWQKSANGCVVSKEDRASPVGYDQNGWQESFKLALEAENCTGEKRLSEWETCKGPPAPIDCVGTWGPNDGWGPCIGSCGTQPSQSRTYTVTTIAQNGGGACPYEDGKVETKSCGTVVTCPVDCAGRWIDTACPTACGTPASTVVKTWYTTTYPQGTGKACPAPDDPEAQKSCPATAPCPSDCEGYYDDPACPTACGTAASTLTKQWNTTTPAVGTGTCPSPSAKSCPATAACPSNCTGYWTDPPCPTACGRAASTVTKTWNVQNPAVGTGTCPSPSTKSCPATAACPSNCVGSWVANGNPYETGSGGCSGRWTKTPQIYRITKARVGTGSACEAVHGATRELSRSHGKPPRCRFSDKRLKTNIKLYKKDYPDQGIDLYSYEWNDIATQLYGLSGSTIGFIADLLPPKYVDIDEHGYKYINGYPDDTMQQIVSFLDRQC